MTTAHRRTPELPPLRAVREAQGLTLEETARRANVNIGYLSRIERGLHRPSIDVLRRIAHVLELRDLERHLSLYDVDPRERRRCV
jgi:transcriptional regulator with XRE-family HTH domain